MSLGSSFFHPSSEPNYPEMSGTGDSRHFCRQQGCLELDGRIQKEGGSSG